MIRPSFRTFIFLIPPLVLSVLFWGNALLVVLLCDFFVLLILAGDFFYSWTAPGADYVLEFPGMHSIGRSGDITVNIRNGVLPSTLRLALPSPEYFEMKNHRFETSLKPRERGVHTIGFRCTRRGLYQFETLGVELKSRWGLLWLKRDIKIEGEIQITPDVESIRTFYRLARLNRLNDLGFHRLNLSGTGMELHHLRSYELDDDARWIDWKASMRLGRPMTKVFSAESSNQITFVIDTGRLMTSEAEGMSLLDYAINGTLLLANVALKMGDAVGIIAVADSIVGELKPVKGPGSQKKILSFLSSLETRYTDTNYRELLSHLHHSHSRRSLIILFNDYSEGIQDQMFLNYGKVLGQRHLMLMMMLRNREVERLAMEHVPVEEEDYFTRTAARDFLTLRSKGLKELRKRHVLVADILPEEINTTLVNQYLALRSANRI
ncbi:MAG: DUF58 domain-containing protein [Spirochaetales bacterium]|nr:DUF58 domain-containing protein [Spirochaetales bacterium]